MMTKNACVWQDIPEEHWKKWREIFGASQESLNLSDPCPICGNKQLHRYYQIGRKKNMILGGNHFIAQGALWEWCSGCRSFLHASAAVPEWWSPPELDIDKSKLTALPEALEQAIRNRQDTPQQKQ